MIVPEWLLAVVATLFLLDIFVSTEFLSWIAILNLSAYATWKLSTFFSWYWLLFIFILTFCVATIAYYLFLRNMLKKITDRTLMRQKRDDIFEKISGKTGVIHIIDGKTMVYLRGELWPIENSLTKHFFDGEQVYIVAIHDGFLQIRKEYSGEINNTKYGHR